MARCFFLFALLLASSWLPARAETTNCANITSLPVAIATQGVYCLKQNLSTSISSGAAITIETNNVTIDCNDWKIGGLAGGAGTNAYGILADAKLNVVVRNCGIRGFSYGIYLAGSGGYHLIEDNRLDNNTKFGIYAAGSGNTIRRNRIYDTGGSSTTGLSAVGIDTYGDSDVLDNTISGLFPSGPNGAAYGIKLDLDNNGVVARNLVSGLNNVGDTGWRAYAIWANGGTPIIRDNSVHNGGTLTTDDWGIVCNVSSAIARDNVVFGFSAPGTPIYNCTSVDNTAP
jgi:parallel beta-helix repeat protein